MYVEHFLMLHTRCETATTSLWACC